MRAPAALLPLRHGVFRALWTANAVTALGTWMQNTGAGWLMTTLSPDAVSVSLVQAATIVPTFLLALPAGALADIVDRRRYLILTQVGAMSAAALLTALTYAGAIEAAGLIALTFAIGVGSAMYQPAWGATVPEVVPRHDLVGAIALNGIGFNLARAAGPALGGVLLLFGGPGLTFLLYAVSFVVSIAVLASWKRPAAGNALPREHFISAMRAGMRFVRHTPAMRAAMIRAVAYFLPTAAVWGLLPLVVREQLGLGAGSFGLLLGLMGVGGVTSGMLLPRLHGIGRGTTVFCASLVSCGGMGLVAATHHWGPAALGMLLFGLGWVAASSTAQAAAQLVAPAWVRARALAIYQLSFNGALAAGSLIWGGLGAWLGLQQSMALAAAVSAVLAVLARRYPLDQTEAEAQPAADLLPMPEAPAPELAAVLPRLPGRILETMRYRVAPRDRAAFLSAMEAVQHVRWRSGALDWRLYEDVAHPDGWLETWSMENWTDHLRERVRLSDEDRQLLATVSIFHDPDAPLPCRLINVDPAQRGRKQGDAAGALTSSEGAV